jgi:hypothetical protein
MPEERFSRKGAKAPRKTFLSLRKLCGFAPLREKFLQEL